MKKINGRKMETFDTNWKPTTKKTQIKSGYLSRYDKSQKQWIANWISVVLIAIVIVAMLRWILSPNSETLTFTKLLQFFVDIQNYQINIINLGDFTIIGDWGIFEGLRNFINMIMSIINLGVWLAQSIINILITTLNGIRLLIFS